MLAIGDIRFSYSFFDKFTVLERLPSCTDLLLRSRDTGQLLLMKEIQVDEDQMAETLATFEYQRGLTHEQLLPLADFHAQPCGTVIVLYEYCRISLKDEFDSRAAEHRGFDESELWSIFSSLALGLAYLQSVNVGHGSVSLLDCYINN
jgi:hypothetical protein